MTWIIYNDLLYFPGLKAGICCELIMQMCIFKLYYMWVYYYSVFQPEGETQYYNKAIFVDLRNKQPFQTTVTLDVPKNIVLGSDMVEVSAVGMWASPH